MFPYDTQIPACHDVAVLEKIASYFAEKESKYWQSSLRIVEYEQIRPSAWRPWGLDYIPRRFCTGKVITTDGVKRRIDYSVREDLAVIGVSWGSSGACTASTATGPTSRPARWHVRKRPSKNRALEAARTPEMPSGAHDF